MALKMRHKLSSESSSRGIALISVLWVLILLSLMAAAISASSRSTGRLTNNLLSATQARYVAQAGIQWAHWGLDIPDDQISWLADGGIHVMSLRGALVRVAVYDEHGKIDLNTATEAHLTHLLIAAEVDDERVGSLVDAILDWRDTDDLRRLNGAEDEDYEIAGLGWQAKDAPYESIAELTQVLGMDEQLYRVIRGSVTVHSRKRVVNPQVAPRLVLLALSELSETEVDQYIEERRRLHKDGLPPPEAPEEVFPPPFFSPGMQALNYTIHTQAVIGPRTRSGLVAVVRRQGRPGRRVFKILDMQQTQDEIFSDKEL